MPTTIKAQAMERKFYFNGVPLPDPDPNLTVEQVRAHYARIYPDITTASIETDVEGGTLNTRFVRAVGKKG